MESGAVAKKPKNDTARKMHQKTKSAMRLSQDAKSGNLHKYTQHFSMF
jgi:hypothetical protein